MEQNSGQVTPTVLRVGGGQSASAMILNALVVFAWRALYLTPENFENKPVDLLAGPELSATGLMDSASFPAVT